MTFSLQVFKVFTPCTDRMLTDSLTNGWVQYIVIICKEYLTINMF